MPRLARVKSGASKYHIMVRSISEIDLFKDDEDKVKYLSLTKRYQYKYGFDVYAYCLMDNHGHLIIDCLGADISKIMHVINFCYAQYYNRKYKRHGHVFQDRFKSKVIDSDRYLINLSAYIHNNPKDIKGYSQDVAGYPFSSLTDYIHETNTFGILNTRVLRNLISLHRIENKHRYLEFVQASNCEEEQKDVEFISTEADYRSEKIIILRDANPQKVISYVANYLKLNKKCLHIKYNSAYTKLRALSCFLLTCFCNITQKEICNIIGNITQSRVSKLANIGHSIALNEKFPLDQILIS